MNGGDERIDVEPAVNDRAGDIDEAATRPSEVSVGIPGFPVPSVDGVANAAEQSRVFESLFEVPAEHQRMGRYVVLDTLGKGGMGTVLEAFDRTLDRRVALKVLHRDLDQRYTARLLREAQALAKLSHPNVVQVYETGEARGQAFIAMELVRGQTLQAWLQQDSRPGWRECVEVYLQAGEGLAAAHSRGLIHRDFKPGNAVIDDDGRVRVLDFGLARGVQEQAREEHAEQAEEDQQRGSSSMHPDLAPDDAVLEAPLTRTGTILGTPAYMPVEQMKGLEADARSDQFSFCASLYEAVYGERPYEGRTLMELMVSVTDGEIRPAPRGSKVPATLRAVLLQGLATDPQERWESMEVLLTELRKRVAPRTRRILGIGAGVGLALAAVVGAVALRQSGELSKKEEELSAKDEVITKSRAELAKQVVELNEQLAAQKGLRAKDMAEEAGHELDAVGLAVEAFGGLDEQSGPIPSPIFEGLTHALAGIHRGIALRGHEGRVYAVALSRDGRHIATASDDQAVRLWDADSGAPLRTFEGHTGPVWAVAFSPDGARLATAGEDETARLWDTATGQPLDSLEHQGPVRSVAYSPDGRTLATASGDVAWLWHLDADAVVVPIIGHDGPVRSVAFTPDGTRLLTTSDDRTARVWVATTGAALATLQGHTAPVLDGVFSPDGTRLATASQDETARLWDAATGEPLASLDHGEVVYAVALSRDGARLATGTFDDSAAHLWDVAAERRLTSFHHTDAVSDVAFSPRGRQLVTASWDHTACSWNLDPGGALTTLEHPSRVDAVTLSADGSRIATGSRDGTARVWDTNTGATLAVLRGHTLDVLAVALSADGTRVATTSWDGSVRVWDADSAAALATMEGHTGPVRAVALSPDGTRLATACNDGTARVWDVATGSQQHALSHEGPVIDTLFAPDGQRLLTVGADDTTRVWDAATGKAVSLAHASLLQEGPVTALAFSADGQHIAAAKKDYSVQSWDADSGETLATFRGHSAPVTRVAFSRDGTRLATASEDGTARVWDAAEGEQLTAFPHEDPVTSVAFLADGSRLVTACGDEVARLWSLEPRAWLTWGCAVLDGRQAHTDATRQACPPQSPDVGEAKPTSVPAEPLISATEALGPTPDVITVHGVELVLIPGGTFTMGSPEGEPGRYDRESPQHEVTLDSFYLARTEVTNAQYALYLEANPDAPKPGLWDNPRYNQPKQPVVSINWYEAKAYCDWAGLVLPTEAQWEYAARAGSTTTYWFGNEAEDQERFGWVLGTSGGSNHRGRAHSVGSLGANPFGLYDVYGNVFEWTLDAYEPYTTSVRAGDGLRREPVGDAVHAGRGGSWFYGSLSARSAYRFRLFPRFRYDSLGLRPSRGVR